MDNCTQNNNVNVHYHGTNIATVCITDMYVLIFSHLFFFFPLIFVVVMCHRSEASSVDVEISQHYKIMLPEYFKNTYG